MLPCAGLPNATGVTPLVAANSWPGEMVRALPGGVLSFPSLGLADSTADVPDEEQAATVTNSAEPATARQAVIIRLPAAR